MVRDEGKKPGSKILLVFSGRLPLPEPWVAFILPRSYIVGASLLGTHASAYRPLSRSRARVSLVTRLTSC